MDLRQTILKKIQDLKQNYKNIENMVIDECVWAKENNTKWMPPEKLLNYSTEMIAINREIDTLCILIASAD